jgi:hypothetical protein
MAKTSRCGEIIAPAGKFSRPSMPAARATSTEIGGRTKYWEMPSGLAIL